MGSGSCHSRPAIATELIGTADRRPVDRSLCGRLCAGRWDRQGLRLAAGRASGSWPRACRSVRLGSWREAGRSWARVPLSPHYRYDQRSGVVAGRDVSARIRKFAEFSRQLGCPAAFAPGVDLYPNPALPFIQLERAGATRNPQMPVLAASATCELTLALNDQPAALTLGEGLFCGQVEIQFQHKRGADQTTGCSRSMSSRSRS